MEKCIREQLDKKLGEHYTLHTEYLESEKFPENGYPRERFDLYNSKYRNLKIDLLICVGVKTVPYYNPEAIRMISSAANSPVFGFSDMGLGAGSCWWSSS